MKTTRLFMVILAIIITTAFAPNAKGQVSELPFGSVEKVEQYAVWNISHIFIWAWYYDTNDTLTPWFAGVWYAPSHLTNKFEMDQVVIAPQLLRILDSLLITTNKNVNKDKGLKVYVSCYMEMNGELAQSSFYTPYTYIIPDKTNGVYSVPDLSWFSTRISSYLPIYIPKTKWVRLEYGLAEGSNQMEVYDRRIDPLTDVLRSDGFMYLPTEVISDSSTTNGNFWLKLSVFSSNTFRSYNGDGKMLPEAPLRTENSISNGLVTVMVSGGDSGRAYYLQQSSNLINWTNCSSVNFVSPFTHLFPGGTVQSFQYQPTSNSSFYRTITTNVPPE